MKKIPLILSLILIFLTGCSDTQKSEQLTVAVSIAPEKTFVEKVVGDKAEIITMIPAGASAENYEMSPKEITAFNNSDIYFAIGVPAEKEGILPHINKSTVLADLTSPISQAYPDLKIGSERDPHIWLSPRRVIIMVEEIALQMADLDPENALFYSDNAKAYIKELKALDLELANKFRDKRRKTFFISHPSYGYFASDYGLEMIALEEHGKEVTPKELAELTSKAKSINATVVFCQEEASKKQAELLAKEIGGRVEILKPLSPDYAQSIRETAKLIAEAVY